MTFIAVIKHEAIHVTPLSAIKYVMNGDKTEQCRFVSGINISDNAEDAYKEFAQTFEFFSNERFYKSSLSEDGGKENIRLHHYIQSFKPGEITAEKANMIGREWALTVFGNGRQILVCTHTDKEHIHNHILVSKYSLEGKVWYDNKTTMKRCREESDKLCRHFGLSVIENPKKKTTRPYSEYIAKKNFGSWKEKLRRDIDRIVLMPNVKNISDLVSELEKLDYEVSGKKYLHVRLAGDKKHKPMQTLKLGDGYALEELTFRIKYKDILIPINPAYIGFQKDTAMYLRQSQLYLGYPRSARKYDVSYKAARASAELLTFLSENNISSRTEFEKILDKADEEYRDLNERKKELTEKKDSAENYENTKIFNELNSLDETIRKKKDERDRIARQYKNYLEMTKSDYDRMLDDLNSGVTQPAESFIDTVRKMSDWATKVHEKAMRQRREDIEKQRRSYYGGAR